MTDSVQIHDQYRNLTGETYGAIVPLKDRNRSMGTERTLKTLVIGVAGRGAVWAKAAAEHPRFTLSGIADVDTKVLDERGEELGIPPANRHGSHEEALNSGLYEAAIIATPNHLHYPVTKDALAGGLHCLVEKPFTETLEHAEELVEKAVEAERIIVVGQNYRNRESVPLITRYITEQRLGRLGGIEASFHRYRPPRRAHEVAMPYPMLYLQAIHHLDWLLSALPSPITEVHARHRRVPWSPFDFPSICHIILKCEDGVLVSYRGSYESRGEITPYDGLWRLEFEHGDLIVDDERRLWELTRDGQKKELLYTPEEGQITGEAWLLDEMYSGITEGKEPATSGRRNLQTLKLLFDVIRADQS